jgi:hypothetical protein
MPRCVRARFCMWVASALKTRSRSAFVNRLSQETRYLRFFYQLQS